MNNYSRSHILQIWILSMSIMQTSFGRSFADEVIRSNGRQIIAKSKILHICRARSIIV
jgi:hypothetical protein